MERTPNALHYETFIVERVAAPTTETASADTRRTPMISRLRIPPVDRRRLAIAAFIGAIAGLVSYAFLNRPGMGGDYFFVWSAARSLLAGQNPYHVIAVGPENPGNDVLLYPLPALLLVAPIASFPIAVSGGLFLGLSSALLAYSLSRDGYHRFPIFMGAPFLMAISLGQWSPLLTAAALEGTLGFAFAAKPNLGLAGWLYRPNAKSVVSALVIVAISLVILPRWPIDWYHNIATRPEKFSPIRTTVGPLLLVAAIRWRRSEARLLIAMACVPQALFFYDQLVLGLIPRTLRQSLVFSLASFAALLAWFYLLKPGDLYVQKAVPYALALYFVALVMVLLPIPQPTGESATVSSESLPLPTPPRVGQLETDDR